MTTSLKKEKKIRVCGNSKMKDKDFRMFSEFIHSQYGIKMPKEKKILLESRLQRRLRALGMTCFSQYKDYVFSSEGSKNEIYHMIDVVTTNKTDFFREPEHFAFLLEETLPELIHKKRHRNIKMWSAGCSTGEEPYTLAMVLSEYARDNSNFNFNILATDISIKVLQTAAQAIYPMERVTPVPHSLKKRYLLRHKDKNKNIVRIAPEVRKFVEFRRLNLMEKFDLGKPVNIIFCRNVMIYFDRYTQEKLLNCFHKQLHPDGYLFLGHSETLHGLNVPYEQVKPTIYRKTKM